MGPEISGTDFLAILLLWGALGGAVTAPGWVAVAVSARRRRIARGPGRSWPAAVAGALVGLLLSALVVPAVAEARPAGDTSTAAGVLAGWAACWLLALAAAPRRRPRASTPAHTAAAGRGSAR